MIKQEQVADDVMKQEFRLGSGPLPVAENTCLTRMGYPSQSTSELSDT